MLSEGEKKLVNSLLKEIKERNAKFDILIVNPEFIESADSLYELCSKLINESYQLYQELSQANYRTIISDQSKEKLIKTLNFNDNVTSIKKKTQEFAKSIDYSFSNNQAINQDEAAYNDEDIRLLIASSLEIENELKRKNEQSSQLLQIRLQMEKEKEERKSKDKLTISIQQIEKSELGTQTEASTPKRNCSPHKEDSIYKRLLTEKLSKGESTNLTKLIKSSIEQDNPETASDSWRKLNYWPIPDFCLEKNYDLLRLVCLSKDRKLLQLEASTKLMQNKKCKEELLHLFSSVEKEKLAKEKFSTESLYQQKEISILGKAKEESSILLKENLYLKYKLKQKDIFKLN